MSVSSFLIKAKYSEKVKGGNKKSVNRPAPDSLLLSFNTAAAEPVAIN
jgi:hypothetical protein